MDENLNANGYINSILRATNILSLYRTLNVTHLGVADISRELGLHKTTVFRIMKTLEHAGWLVQDTPNGKYKLGTKFYLLSSVPLTDFTVEDTIHQEMKTLRDRFNEDIVLTGLMDGHLAICIEKIRSNNALHISSRVGRVIGMARGSTGKVLLAHLPEENRDKALELEEPNMSQEERQKLEQQLERIRQEGYCISNSERDEGVSSITVPLFGRNRKILYSLGIVGEENRMNHKGMDMMRQALFDSAQRLQDLLPEFDRNDLAFREHLHFIENE